MKVLLIVFFCLVFILMVLTFPIKVKGAVHINIKEDIGFGAIKLMHLKLFCAKFKIAKSGKLEMQNAVKPKKKKNKTISKCYFSSLIKFMEIRKVEFFLDAGTDDNAYLSSMLCGYVSAIVSSLLAVVMKTYKNVRVFTRYNPSFEKNRLELSGAVVIKITLLDMILSLGKAYVCYFKELKEKKYAR